MFEYVSERKCFSDLNQQEKEVDKMVFDFEYKEDLPSLPLNLDSEMVDTISEKKYNYCFNCQTFHSSFSFQYRFLKNIWNKVQVLNW